MRRLVPLAVLAGTALTGCGDDASSRSDPTPIRTVEIAASEYQFTGDPDAGITAGETIRFVVSNEGALSHEMQVLTGDGRLIDRTEEIPPGGRDEVTVSFGDAGTYQVICDIDDHLTRGQRATFTVAEN